MKTSFAPAIWGWVILIVVASFLSWGTLRLTSSFGFPGGSLGDLFGGSARLLSISLNGWNGHLNLGVQLPNWLAVVAAVAAAGTVYLQSTGAQLSPRLAPALLLYSFTHVALFSAFLLLGGQGTLGIGAIAMLAGVGGLSKALFQARRRPPN